MFNSVDDGVVRCRAQREAWAVGAISLLLFSLGFLNQEFHGFQTRFGLFAQEMLRHGPSVFPTTLGKPYPDYPATSTLFIWLLSLPVGSVTTLAAILPTALFSSVTLVVLYQLLAPLSQRWAFFSVCVAATTAMFLMEARSISLDQMLTTVATLSFYLLYTRDFGTVAQRMRPTMRWVYALLVLGFAIRGPMGVVIPAGVVCSYLACTRQWRAVIIFGVATAALIVVCWAALMGLAYLEGGREFVSDVIRMQVAKRLDRSLHTPVYYYFYNSLGNYAFSFLPALGVMLWLLPRWRRASHNAREQLLLLLAAWALVVLCGLSIPHAKKARYILPAAPALAALAAYPLVFAGTRWLRIVRGLLWASWWSLPWLGIAALLYLPVYVKKRELAVDLPITALLLALALCAAGMLIVWWRARHKHWREPVLALFAVLAFWIIDAQIREPADQQLRSGRHFVRQVEQIRQAQPAPLVMYRMPHDAVAIVYLVNADAEIQPIFAREPSQLQSLSYPVYVIAKASKAKSLLEAGLQMPQPIHAGKFYGDDYVVYRLEQKP